MLFDLLPDTLSGVVRDSNQVVVETPMAPRQQRVLFLDGLRGVAAVIVVLNHAFLGYADPEHRVLGLFWSGPFSFLTEGDAAVLLFFVLSGIALSWGPMGGADCFRSAGSIAVWFLARVVRIYLPYLAALALTCVAHERFRDPGATVPPRTPWFGLHGEVAVDHQNVLHDLNLFSDYPRLLGQGWSLTEELRFSFLLPLMLPLAVRTTGGFLVTLFCAALCGAMTQFVLFFGVGVLVTKHWNSIPGVLRHVSGWRSWVVLVFAVGLFSIRRWLPWYFPDASHELKRVCRPEYLVAVGVLLILVLPIVSSGLRRFLESGMVRYLGQVSFSIYLIHMVVLLYVSPWVVVRLNAMGLAEPAPVTVAITLFVVLASCATASVFNRLVEAPCTNAARWLLRWFEKRSAVPQPK